VSAVSAITRHDPRIGYHLSVYSLSLVVAIVAHCVFHRETHDVGYAASMLMTAV